MEKYDLIVIGAGHSGLIAAASLAKSGLKTLVLEKSHLLGGCSRTDPNIFPGYKVDAGAQTISHPVLRIAKDLGLEQFGFEPLIAEPSLRFLLGKNIDITAYKDIEATCHEIAKYSKEEADSYRRFIKAWAMVSSGFAEIMRSMEPTYTRVFQMLESQGPKAIRLYLSSASDVLKSYFSTDWMGGISRIVLMFGLHPRWLGTGFATQFIGRFHWSPSLRAKGGMEGLVGSLARCIEHYGGKVRNNSGVSKIIIENSQAKGVRLESGEEIEGDIILAGTHAKITYFNLVGEENLEPDFIEHIRGLREGVSVCSAILKLSEKFPLNVVQSLTADGLEHIEGVCDGIFRGELSDNPSIVIINPCPQDPSIAPPGGNYIVVSSIVPFHLKVTTWEAEKERHAEDMIKVLERRLPGIKRLIIDRRIKSPADFTAEMNLWEGDVAGPAATIDQQYSMRPRYKSPLRGLYLTGMCTHPSGAVLGLSGYNAATIIRGDLEKGVLKK